MSISVNYAKPASFQEPDRLVHPSPWLGHIPFAFWAVATLKPRLLVELGTQSGNSFCAFMQAGYALGLASNFYAVDHWLGDGQAWEYGAKEYGDEIYDELDKYLSERYGAPNRLIRSSFDDALDKFSDGSIDLLHIDGLHTYAAVKHDFETWLPKLSDRSIVLFHDSQERESDFGVYKLILELKERYPVLDFQHSHGLAVVAVGHQLPDEVSSLCGGRLDSSGFEPISFFASLGRSVVERFAFTEMLAAQHRKDQLQTLINNLNAQRVDAERQYNEMKHFSSFYRDVLTAHTRSVTAFSEEYRLANRILNSGFFNPCFYRDQSELVGDDLELIKHYLDTGEATGLLPSTQFNPSNYLAANPDVAAAGQSPLVHYIAYGKSEGRPLCIKNDDDRHIA